LILVYCIIEEEYLLFMRIFELYISVNIYFFFAQHGLTSCIPSVCRDAEWCSWCVV